MAKKKKQQKMLFIMNLYDEAGELLYWQNQQFQVKEPRCERDVFRIVYTMLKKSKEETNKQLEKR